MAPLAIAAIAAALAGCGGKGKKSTSAGGSSSSSNSGGGGGGGGAGGGGGGAGGGGGGGGPVTLSVAPSKTSNHGRPLHALVRAVTLKQFAEEPYNTVAQLVVSPDESVLASFVVFPGIDQSIKVERPAKGAVAVYFLFTGATGTSWKQLFDSPPSKIRLELGEDAIVQPGSASPKTGGKGKPQK
jgi:hypothetical protein